MNRLPTLCGALVVSLAAAATAADLKARDLTLAVNKDGCGFVDAATFKGRQVVLSKRGFLGGRVALAKAGDGTASSLFPSAVAARLTARVATLTAAGGKLLVTGAYSDGTSSVPFRRELQADPARSSVTVSEQADFSRLSAGYLVAEHALELPLVVSPDEHLRMLAFGGERRVEMFRMDMNDERRRNQLLSDNRAYWPYWDIGGIIQGSEGYHIWRANHADTMAYPIEHGRKAPGWADYSEPDWGLTVQVLDPQKAAPWAIRIDARTGTLAILLHPPDQMPIAGSSLGKRTIRFALTFHESSRPAAYPCELHFDLYKRFLDYLNHGTRYTHLNYLCGGVGIHTGDGKKSPKQMEDIYRRIIFKERIQPSVLLRLMYRGDGWRMAGLVREVLGKRVSRSQPMAAWEKLAGEFFAKIKRDGLPRR